MSPRTASILIVVAACGGGQASQPAPVAISPGAPPDPSAAVAAAPSVVPFNATGTFLGTKFTFTCADAKSAAPGTDTLAVEGTGDGTVVSCHDLTSGFTVTLTLVAPAVGNVTFTHSHVGPQIGFATPSWGTSSVTPSASPTLTINEWDTAHRSGTYKLTWPSDPKNNPGSVEGSFAF